MHRYSIFRHENNPKQNRYCMRIHGRISSNQNCAYFSFFKMFYQIALTFKLSKNILKLKKKENF